MRRLSAGAVALLCLTVLSLTPSSARGDGVVTALGDSLTAGLGVAADEAYPARLEARLRAEGYAYRVINAGVSGDTTAGGLRRVDWVLRGRPEVVIVALGASVVFEGLTAPPRDTDLMPGMRRRRHSGAMSWVLIAILIGALVSSGGGRRWSRRVVDGDKGADIVSVMGRSDRRVVGTVGGSRAFVGFTAGTGGLTSTDNILSWAYTPLA